MFAFFFGTQVFLNYRFRGLPEPFSRIIAAWFICGYLWFLLTPIVVWLTRRFPIDKEALFRNLGLHLLFGAAISLFQLGAYSFLFQLLIVSSDILFPLGAFREIVVGDFHFNLLLYFVVVGLYQAYDYYQRFRERERRAAQDAPAAASSAFPLQHAQHDCCSDA